MSPMLYLSLGSLNFRKGWENSYGFFSLIKNLMFYTKVSEDRCLIV